VALTAVGVFTSTLEIRTSQVAVAYDLSWLAEHRYHSGGAANDVQSRVTDTQGESVARVANKVAENL
jgi:hypothetical protein